MLTDFFKTKSIFEEKHYVLSQHLPELIAVKFGLKISTMISIHNKYEFYRYIPLLVKFCSRTDLFCDYYIRKNEYKVLISNRKLPIVADSEEQNKNNRFSYPECCRDNYSKMTLGGIKYILVNEKENTHFDFEMNPFLKRSPFHLYLHIPCSLTCDKTLNYARNLLAVIKKNNMELYSAVVQFNKVPVFYVDVCESGILFDGIIKSEDNTRSIYYRDIYYPVEPENQIDKSDYNSCEDIYLFKSIIRALRKGEVVMLQDNLLTIRSKNQLIGCFEKPDHLFWKMFDFS